MVYRHQLHPKACLALPVVAEYLWLWPNLPPRIQCLKVELHQTRQSQLCGGLIRMKARLKHTSPRRNRGKTSHHEKEHHLVRHRTFNQVSLKWKMH